MLGKLLWGALIIGGVYVGYKAYQAVKGTSASGATSSTSSTSPTLSPAEMEKAAWLAQKYIPGYTDTGLEGGCMGCMGAARVQIL